VTVGRSLEGVHGTERRVNVAAPPSNHCQRQHPCRFSSRNYSSSGKVTEVTASDIINFCTSHGISNMGLRQQSQHVVIKECPFCEKPTKNMADNQHKIYVKIGDGVYFCHRCGAKGSWNDFQRHIAGDQHQEDAEAWSEIGHIRMSPRHPPPARGYDRTTDTPSTAKSLPMPSERLNSCYITSLLDQPGTNPSLEYLTKVRGFTTSTLRKYGVGRGTYNFPGEDGRFVPAECITFPWILPAAEVVEQEELRGATIELPPNQAFVTRRIKARALENKAWQRLDPPGGGWGLFGYHTIPADATEIVVTEGEYDAMAGT
jgi:twinkle protein